MLGAVNFILRSLNQRGFSSEQLLAGSGLTESQIRVPWLPLLPDQYRAIVGNAIALTGDDGIGLQLGFELNLADLGPAAFAAMTAPTFADARKTALHLQLLMDPVLYVRYSGEPRGWMTRLYEVYPLEKNLRFAVEYYLARSQRVIASLTGVDDVVREVGLSYAEPDNGDDYRRGFNCPVHFNAGSNWIVFDPNVLQLRLPLANADTHRLLVSECEQRLAQLDVTTTMAQRVYLEIMRSRTHPSFPALGLEEMADRLCMGARTLRRRLADEHTSYLQIVDNIRRELSLHLLTSTQLSAKEIAYELGYSSVNNFRRAFKAWTGESISEFRAETDNESEAPGN